MVSSNKGWSPEPILVGGTAEITYSAGYTPWGDMLESHGSGNFSIGYYGGLLDAATG
ncbi:MAG TPA: hypothetical protein VMJ64_02980 [Anaerolineales bacterium]|nr:hypothetical protein [Anaerolineales bacterium]